MMPSLVVALSLASVGFPGFQEPCEVLKWTEPGTSNFGFSLDLREDRLAVGVLGGLSGFSSPGLAYIYEREGFGWELAAVVSASDGAPGEANDFGYSVAIDGDTALVGATSVGTLGAKGAAYLFDRQPDGTWLDTQKIENVVPDAWAFGWAVDLEGDRALIGAKGASALGDGEGAAFVLERGESGWTEVAELVPSIGARGDGFGAAVALDGDSALVGASYQWTSIPPREGRAFLFERQMDGAWIETRMFFPDDISDADRFGAAVALDGGTILIGAPNHDLPAFNGGVAYVFEEEEGSWSESAKLAASDAAPIGAHFGEALALRGDTLVVGADGDDVEGVNAGAAYRFDRSAGEWSETGKFHGSGVQAGDSFGVPIAMDATEVLIASSGPDVVHAFEITGLPPSILADTGSTSIAAGETQELQLGACSEHAGDIYVLAGSASGTAPGFGFGGLPIPLNVDPYLLFTLAQPGAPPLADSVGVLDAWGRATASFTPPPATDPGLAGLVLHHAYGVLDATTLALEAVSGAVGVQLVP